MMGFELRAIPGLEGYFAATDGSIWSSQPYRGRPKGLYPVKMRRERHGYIYVTLGAGKTRPRHYTVHRLIALTFLGPRPDRMHVCHLNHDKQDNRLENLSYGTAKDNIAQSVAIWRHAHGERHGIAKLTDEQVIDIRARLAAGESKTALARAYGVSERNIRWIELDKAWRHLA